MSDDELENLRQIALMSMKSRAGAIQNNETAAPTSELPVPEPKADNIESNMSGSEDDGLSSEGETEEEAGTESGNISEKREDEEEEEVDEFMKEIEDFENFLGLNEEKPKEDKPKKKKSKKKKKKRRSSKAKDSVPEEDPSTEDKENICADAEQSKNELPDETENTERCQSRGDDFHSRSHSPIRHSASPQSSHYRSHSPHRDGDSYRSRSPYSQRSRSPWGPDHQERYENSRRYSRSPRSPGGHYQRSISRSLTPDSMRRKSPLSYNWPEPSRPFRRTSNSPTEYWRQDYRRTRADEDRSMRIDSIEGSHRSDWRRDGRRPYYPRDNRVPYYKAKQQHSDSEEEEDPNLKKFEEERRRRGEERRRRQEERRQKEEERRRKEEEKQKFLEENRKRLREEREEAERKRQEREEQKKAEAERKKKEEEEEQRKKEEEEFQKKLSEVPEAERQRLIARRQKFLSNQPVKIEGAKKINLKHIKESEEVKEPQHELLYHIEIDEDSSESESESRFKTSRPKRKQQPLTQTLFHDFTHVDDVVRGSPVKRKHEPENEDDKGEDLRARLQKKRAMRKKDIPEEENAPKSGDDVKTNFTIEIKTDEDLVPVKKSKLGRRRVLIVNKEKTVQEELQITKPIKKKSKDSALNPRLTTKSTIQRLGLPIKSEMTSRLSRVSKRIQEQQRDPEEEKPDAVSPFKSVRVLKIGSKGIDG